MSDVVYEVKTKCPPTDYALDTAEGRYQWDQDLRKELSKIEPPGLRQHAANMIKTWRWSVLKPRDEQILHTSIEVTSIEDAGIKKQEI